MSEICCLPPLVERSHSPAHRRVLWIVLGINLAMFIVELIAGLIVAAITAVLALQVAAVIVTQARAELAGAAA